DAGKHQLILRAKDERGSWSIRAIESFFVHLPVPLDVQVMSMNLEDGECLLTNATEIKVQLRNSGQNPVSDFDIVLAIDGNILATERVVTEILPSAEHTHTFAYKADLSQVATYHISVYTLLADDDRPENDTLHRQIIHNQKVIKGVSPGVTICNTSE